MSTYTHLCEELSNAGIAPIDGGNIFQFDESPLAVYYSAFLKWGQDFLNREDLGLNISPARIFFNPDVRTNACAYTRNGYALIEINQGTILNLFRRFFMTNDRFDDPTVRDYRNLALLFEQAPAFLIFQNICLMFFYHEVGHLVQQRDEDSSVYREFLAEECGGRAVWERHVRELDADWFSANNFAQTVLESSQSRNGLHLSLVEFEDFAALMLSSIYIYFMSESFEMELYFERKCHPHPAIRLAYYIQTKLDTLENLADVAINKQGVADAARQIADVMLSDDDNAVPNFYDQLLQQHRNEIRAYIITILSNTKSYPCSTWRLLGGSDSN